MTTSVPCSPTLVPSNATIKNSVATHRANPDDFPTWKTLLAITLTSPINQILTVSEARLLLILYPRLTLTLPLRLQCYFSSCSGCIG